MRNVHLSRYIVPGNGKQVFVTDCKQSLFCSKILWNECKKSEHNQQAVGGECSSNMALNRPL